MSKTTTLMTSSPAAILPEMSSTRTNSWLQMNNNIIGGDYNNNHHSARYSTDGMFFLAAVLSLALAIALVFLLHLCIRRILLRSRSRHLPHHHRSTSHRIFVVTSQAQASSSGLAPSALAAIPTFEYRKNAAADRSPAECAVCLSAVEEGEEVRLLPNCKHVFHVGCIDMWLQSHCTCPVCRAGVEPPSKAEEVVRLPTAGAWPGAKDGSSSSPRIGASFRRMLSAKEWSGRRPAHGDDGVIEDVERQ